MIPPDAPARAPMPAPAGATPGTPAATSGGAASGVPPNAEVVGEPAEGVAAVQLGGTDNDPMDAPWPTPADIDEPAAPSPATPDTPCVPEPRPAATPNGESPPTPGVSVIAPAAPGPRKPALVAIWAACSGLMAPVDVNVFQTLALGPQVLQKLSSWELPVEPPLSRPWSSDSADVDGVDVAGVAIPCSVVGTADVNCDKVACVLVLEA